MQIHSRKLELNSSLQVRTAAAETLYLHTSEEDLLKWDWTRSTAELKPAVLGLRKTLGLAKS